MQSPVRAVAHAAVLAVVAGLCLAVVASGAFDVVSLPDAAPAAAPSPPAAAEGDDAAPADDGGAGDPPGTTPDEDAPVDPGVEGEGATADPAAGTAVDPVCRDAEVAWGAAAKAQVNLTVEHPEALVDGFTTARDTLAETTPPEEIARDWAVVTTYLTMIADEVEATGAGDTGELSRAIDRVGRRIDTGALTTSSQAVTDYFRAGCTR
ncbi:MAG: hypothetical protein K0S43_1600 [Cellulosimicrobium sp.]|jgi:hypothetical protein|nr:hypothetical protein [Cellulosimicrobium sp.]